LIKFLNFMNWIWIKKSINKMNFILLNFFETSISKSSKWCLFKNFLSLILILSLIKCLIFLTMFLNRQFLSNWKMLSD
jgi:flagellar biogenesis protein FliO